MLFVGMLMRIYIYLILQKILETIRIVARMYNDVLDVYFTPSLTLVSPAVSEIVPSARGNIKRT